MPEPPTFAELIDVIDVDTILFQDRLNREHDDEIFEDKNAVQKISEPKTTKAHVVGEEVEEGGTDDDVDEGAEVVDEVIGDAVVVELFNTVVFVCAITPISTSDARIAPAREGELRVRTEISKHATPRQDEPTMRK
jgi:hypothetical protein